MSRPTVIMITSNGIGAGHLIRSSAIARKVSDFARPVILSMAYSVVEVGSALGIECEYIPGRDKRLMPNRFWDKYLRNRILALIEETDAKVVTFDGVVPHPGFLSAKLARPDIRFIWIRRGMWQKQPQGVALGIQSKLVDSVIEPGDTAREYDVGPTKNRREALVTSPVTMYQSETSMTRSAARQFLGLPENVPIVLVQMGVGEKDLDERVSAIVKGLKAWSGVHIVMAKEPKDSAGNSLIPDGINVTIIRHFPLADVIHAFDGIVCAAGYNSVHEVIPASVPTLLIANNRGTDDQFARAQWCGDKDLTLYARSDSIQDIEEKSALLSNATIREKLIGNCSLSPSFTGAEEIASVIKGYLSSNSTPHKTAHRRSFGTIINTIFQRGWVFTFRRFALTSLWWASLIYRKLFPHKYLLGDPGDIKISHSRDAKFLNPFIRGQHRLEHLLSESSDKYQERRVDIAQRAFKLSKNIEVVNLD